MKFKKDDCGWRDLRIEQTDTNWLQVSINIDTAKKAKDRYHFIAVSEGGEYAAFTMTIPQLRKMAKAILKETSR